MHKLLIFLVGCFISVQTYAQFMQQQQQQQMQLTQQGSQQSTSDHYKVIILDHEYNEVQRLACNAGADECYDVAKLNSQESGGWVENPIILSWKDVRKLPNREITLRLKSSLKKYEIDEDVYEVIE